MFTLYSTNFGTEHSTAALSVDDRQAVDILQHGMVKLEVGYEVPITWRTGEPNLPNNRLLAEKRLQSLLRRFQLEPAFEKEYRAAMQKNFDKGYAIVLGDQPASDGEYYTAHHGVYKGPKLRVVFDAAAKFRGKCLNDAMLRGPALQTPLAAVLIRFREGAVAWAADVEAMFSRVRLRQSDKPYFRFLWQREGEQNISVCEMQRCAALRSDMLPIHRHQCHQTGRHGLCRIARRSGGDQQKDVRRRLLELCEVGRIRSHGGPRDQAGAGRRRYASTELDLKLFGIPIGPRRIGNGR